MRRKRWSVIYEKRREIGFEQEKGQKREEERRKTNRREKQR